MVFLRVVMREAVVCGWERPIVTIKTKKEENKMNWKNLLCGTIMCAGVGLKAQEAASLPAQEEDSWRPEVKLSIDYKTRYLSKGRVCNHDRTMFGDLSLSLKGAYVGIWNAFDLTDSNGYRNETEEFDFYAGYNYTIGDLGDTIKSITIDGSWWYYRYPSAHSGDSWELCLNVSLETFLSPGFEIYYDVENDFAYAGLYAGYDFVIPGTDDKLSWTNKAELWWGSTRYNYCGEAYPDTYKNAIFSLVYDTGLTYAFNKHISASVFGEIGWLLDDDIREYHKDRPRSNAVNCLVGANVTFKY